MSETIVTVSIQRRLLWEMRNLYDEATVDDLLRVIYCARHEMKYGAVCGSVIISYVMMIILAVNMPGPILAQWPALLLVGALALLAYLRAYRKMLPYGRVRMAIVNADPEKFTRIHAELAPLEKDYLKAERENVPVSLRL